MLEISRFRVVLLLFCTELCIADSKNTFAFLEKIKSNINTENQETAAWNIINRIVPQKSNQFKTFIKDDPSGKDTFTIIKRNNAIEITGSTGVAIAWGFNYYLKNYCNSHIGWQVRHIHIEDDLPDVNVTITARDKYYQNVCTASYSFVWWSTEEWRNHIDWMALNGINLALAPHGQEAVWLEIFRKLNMTDGEIDEHFTGPAFLSWQRMGNVRGWGGPLSSLWLLHSIKLQHFILDAMNEIGIFPALPAFAGFVPTAFKRIFPDAKMREIEKWNGFEPKYCCMLFVEPTDPLFDKIGNMFLTVTTQNFGYSHFYYSDPFNEIMPTSVDELFVKNVSAAIFKSMADVDPQALWIVQGWMFVHDSIYWSRERVKTFLQAIPLGRMLILDLQSEQWPQYEKYDMYFGQPFIWCLLLNFGGTLGMFGDSESINKDVYDARNAVNSTMVGIGITAEGINQNYVMYDLLLESPLRDGSVDIPEWIGNYSKRRYGKSNENIVQAWNILMGSVYNYTGLNKMRGKYVITLRPSTRISPWAWYSGKDLFDAVKIFIQADKDLNTSNGYNHDLVDITRQFLQYKSEQLYILILKSYTDKNIKELNAYSDMLLQLFDDMDKILSSNEHFLLGKWLESAKNLAEIENDKNNFEFNARNQITLWGPNGEIIDYACKQWGGLMSDYYSLRWKLFLSELNTSLANDSKLNEKKIKKMMFTTVEEPFTHSKKVYPTTATENTVDVARRIFDKWSRYNFPDVPIRFIPKRDIADGYTRLRREFHEIDDDNDYDIITNDVYPHVLLLR